MVCFLGLPSHLGRVAAKQTGCPEPEDPTCGTFVGRPQIVFGSIVAQVATQAIGFPGDVFLGGGCLGGGVPDFHPWRVLGI